MRLIVCDTRHQAHNLAIQYPDDKVVVVGDRLSGIRVNEIVDETHMPPWLSTERTDQWWEYAQCRVAP